MPDVVKYTGKVAKTNSLLTIGAKLNQIVFDGPTKPSDNNLYMYIHGFSNRMASDSNPTIVYQDKIIQIQKGPVILYDLNKILSPEKIVGLPFQDNFELIIAVSKFLTAPNNDELLSINELNSKNLWTKIRIFQPDISYIINPKKDTSRFYFNINANDYTNFPNFDKNTNILVPENIWKPVEGLDDDLISYNLEKDYENNDVYEDTPGKWINSSYNSQIYNSASIAIGKILLKRNLEGKYIFDKVYFFESAKELFDILPSFTKGVGGASSVLFTDPTDNGDPPENITTLANPGTFVLTTNISDNNKKRLFLVI
jgi:hypothetical protein